MRNLPHQVRIETTRAAQTNAEKFVAAARREVEVETGELRDTIRAYPARGYQGAVWRAVAGVNGEKGFYARYREFGTRYQTANPFFFPIYRAMRRSFKARNGRAIKKATQKAKR